MKPSPNLDKERNFPMSSLACLDHGDAANPPLLILHGLFGSGRNWGTIARKLSAHYRVFALDLPNHGRSDWTDGPMDYPFMAQAVANWMDEQTIPSAKIIGHSMGGKTAMQLALRYPERVESLALIDIAPVPYGPREHLGYIQAMQSVDLKGITRRSEVETLLEDGIPEPVIRKFLMQNLVQDDRTGYLRWQINLDILAQSVDALMDFPLPEDLEPYAAPAFFLAGGASDYVLPEHEPAIKRLFLDHTLERIHGGGHWLHAEHPNLFLEKVGAFLGV
jgi:pimeloyl-ACP methyl ester carboxylesterase